MGLFLGGSAGLKECLINKTMTYDQNAVPGRPASILFANSTARHMGLANKTLFITGGSRGIGLAIALRAARDGANIAIAAKTAEPHPKLPGTIYSAAQDFRSPPAAALTFPPSTIRRSNAC